MPARTIGGYTAREWEWIREARRPKAPRNVWGWPPGTYGEVMSDASDNSLVADTSKYAPEHISALPRCVDMSWCDAR